MIIITITFVYLLFLHLLRFKPTLFRKLNNVFLDKRRTFIYKTKEELIKGTYYVTAKILIPKSFLGIKYYSQCHGTQLETKNLIDLIFRPSFILVLDKEQQFLDNLSIAITSNLVNELDRYMSIQSYNLSMFYSAPELIMLFNISDDDLKVSLLASEIKNTATTPLHYLTTCPDEYKPLVLKICASQS